MANRNFDFAWTLGKRIVNIEGSFDTNGASNPVAPKGQGFRKVGIVHAATGQYTVTMDDPYLDLNAWGADLQVNAASPNWAQVGPVTNLGTASPVVVTIFTINSAGTAVDVAAGANSRVAFFLTFRDSTVGQNKP